MVRVVIVGAGPCGLAALKEVLEGRHEATLFERTDKLGGVFASAAIYPNLHLTISNWAMAFSGFPDPSRLHYSSAEEYLRYLQSYARHFELERHIEYSSEVCSATLSDDGRWDLQVRQQRGSTQTTLDVQADALIVATGANQLPNSVPASFDGFEGRVLHSRDYNATFKGEVAAKKLRVLVVGGGESGADIASELSELSSKVSVWLRRYPCIGPRYLNAKDEMAQVEANKTADFPANGFLEAATTSRMSAALNVYGYGLFRQLLWHTPVLNGTLARLSMEGTAAAPLRTDQATYVTKNQRLAEAVQSGRVSLLVSPSVHATGDTVVFDMPNGSRPRRTFDVIVLATGFRFAFPWLHLPDTSKAAASFTLNPRTWYLHCFPPGLGHSLFFVGFARPHQGGIPAMAEMLAQYISLLLSGERNLPEDYESRARRDGKAEEEYYSLSPHLKTLVDYNAFLESVARRIGCEPRLPPICIGLVNVHLLAVLALVLGWCLPANVNVAILGLNVDLRWLGALLWAVSVIGFLTFQRGLLFKWWFYPYWSVWYRQRGPGARPALVDAMLRRTDVWEDTGVTVGFMLLILWFVPGYYMQRLLSIVVFALGWVWAIFQGPSGRDCGAPLRPKLFALHDCEWRAEDLFLP